MPFNNFIIFLIPLLIRFKSAVGAEYRISDASGFNSFVDDVNNKGSNYLGTTVLLDSDLSLTGYSTNPIGKEHSASYQFRGVFDGQGHVVSDFNISSSSLQYTGLFGYSTGLTIRNVVLDSSCSITNSYNKMSAYIGGIIGYCSTTGGECSTENSVNMVNATFKGVVENPLYLGGIAGWLSASSFSIYVKNCANYGSLTHSGSGYHSYVGGIAGYFYSLDSKYKYIYNCLNYGTITHDGTTTNALRLGGIVGYSAYAYIENCVSACKIYTQNTPSKSYVGSITGEVVSNTFINNSFWTSDVGEYPAYGTGSPTIDGEMSQAEVNKDLMNKLNNYASKNSTWNKWLLNTNNVTVSFKVNDNAGFNVSSQVILLPDPATNGTEYTFSGWYTDATLTSPFTDNEVNAETTLYGMLCGSSNYTVTLDVNGGNASLLSVNSMTITPNNNVYGELPEVNRTGYTFTGWFTKSEGGDKVESGDKVASRNNHTLYAQWTANNYTVTFIFGNGTGSEVRVFPYNTSIEYPENATREGYNFNGWDINITSMPAHNLIITAQWIANNTNAVIVTFDVNGGDASSLPSMHQMAITCDNVYGELPEVNRTGYTFTGWFTKSEGGDKVESGDKVANPNNHTLYAQWTPNIYAVTFDANGGNGPSVTTINVTFNSTYGALPEAEKEGYMFMGWFTDSNESVTGRTVVSIADDHTLHAHWDIPTSQVEIVFGTKDLSRDDVEKIVKGHVDDDTKFTIEIFDDNGKDETRVIIKFDDARTAQNFVEIISTLDEDIKGLGFVSDSIASFSAILHPILPFISLFA